MSKLTSALQQWVRRQQRKFRLLGIVIQRLLLLSIFPFSPVPQALGHGGAAASLQTTCGRPAQVFAALIHDVKYILPTKE